MEGKCGKTEKAAVQDWLSDSARTLWKI